MAAEVVSDSAPCQSDAVGQAVPAPRGLAGSDEPKSLTLGRPGYVPQASSRRGAHEIGTPFSLSIIMAAFNEERTIGQAIQELLSSDLPCDIELIVVDDGSTDETPKILADVSDPRVVIHHHEHNRGKGAALLSGAAIANGTYVLPFDADLEYAAEDVARLLEPVLKGRCIVVYGARLFGYNTVYRSYRYAMGNKTLTRFANVIYDACLSDLHTCLKLIPTELMRSLRLTENGFGLDTEITASLLRIGVRPFEVPVSYFGRSHAEGKKITWRDALTCVRILLRVRLSRRPAQLATEAAATSRTYVAGRHLRTSDPSEVGPTSDGASEEYARVVG